jgi:hypothetical protein
MYDDLRETMLKCAATARAWPRQAGVACLRSMVAAYVRPWQAGRGRHTCVRWWPTYVQSRRAAHVCLSGGRAQPQ